MATPNFYEKYMAGKGAATVGETSTDNKPEPVKFWLNIGIKTKTGEVLTMPAGLALDRIKPSRVWKAKPDASPESLHARQMAMASNALLDMLKDACAQIPVGEAANLEDLLPHLQFSLSLRHADTEGINDIVDTADTPENALANLL